MNDWLDMIGWLRGIAKGRPDTNDGEAAQHLAEDACTLAPHGDYDAWLNTHRWPLRILSDGYAGCPEHRL